MKKASITEAKNNLSKLIDGLASGSSTGPHLHYEFHRGGRQVNPLAQKFAMRAQVGGKDAARFQGLAKQYLAQLKNAPVVADTKKKPKDKDPPQVAKGD